MYLNKKMLNKDKDDQEEQGTRQRTRRSSEGRISVAGVSLLLGNYGSGSIDRVGDCQPLEVLKASRNVS